jgi:hypothetical protein
MLASYAMARVAPRAPKRLYARRAEIMKRLRAAYMEARSFRDERAASSKLPSES